MSRQWIYYYENGRQVFMEEAKRLADPEELAAAVLLIEQHQIGNSRFIDDEPVSGRLRVLRAPVEGRTVGVLYAYHQHQEVRTIGQPDWYSGDAIMIALAVYCSPRRRVPSRERRRAKARLRAWETWHRAH